MKLNNSLGIFMSIAAIILGIMLYMEKCGKSNNRDKELEAFITAMSDSLHHYKVNDSVNKATIAVLKTENSKDFIKIKTDDQEVQRLQAVVKQYQGKLVSGSSVTNALIETLSKTVNPTIITKSDTVRKDSLVYIYPTYKDTAKAKDKKWIDYTVIANKDSVSLDLKVNNEFSAIVGQSKGKPFVDLVTDNPYSSTKKLRTYQVSLPRVKRIGIGPIIGWGIGSSFKPQVFIGAGIQYSILRL